MYWIADNSSSKETIDLLNDIAFNDESFEVQEKAVYALYELDKNKGIPGLIEIAKNHKDINLRKKAIYWLGQSKDSRARETLLEIINEK